MGDFKALLGDLPLEAFKGASEGKFAPKMTRDERCVVLALVRSGIKRELVAKTFGIDKRTVAHIVNENGPHYREVRKEYRDEGHDAFCTRYLTGEVMERVKGHLDAAIKEVMSDKPKGSAYAAKMRGVHAVQPEQCGYVHQIEIGYLAKESLDRPDGTKYPEWDGWYYRDLTSEDKSWYHNGPESIQNSKTCFDLAVANLMDD